MTNCEKKIEARPIKAIVASLGKLSELWLKKEYFYRKKALKRLTQNSGFTPDMAEALLDSLFKELTAKKLTQLLASELKDPLALDGFRKDPITKRLVRARGPRLITHIFAGNVPNPAILSFIFGMLLKSRNVGKLSSEDSGFLAIYLESLKELDADLAKSNFLVKPSDKASIRAWMKKADLVVAYGSDETLAKLRTEACGVPFIGYGHRASFAIYTREVLKQNNVNSLARKTARDVWMLDQRGCLSPLALYLQKGAEVAPDRFAKLVHAELKRLSRPGRRCGSTFSQATRAMIKWDIRSVRQVGFAREFGRLSEVYDALRPLQRYLQAVSVEAGLAQRKKIAEELSRLGVNRVCRAGQMQRPPLTWHHDGKFNLASWVNWTDLEL